MSTSAVVDDELPRELDRIGRSMYIVSCCVWTSSCLCVRQLLSNTDHQTGDQLTGTVLQSSVGAARAWDQPREKLRVRTVLLVPGVTTRWAPTGYVGPGCSWSNIFALPVSTSGTLQGTTGAHWSLSGRAQGSAIDAVMQTAGRLCRYFSLRPSDRFSAGALLCITHLIARRA